MVMRYLIFLVLMLLLSGCINQNGISAKYYDDCHIEYDMYGSYKKVCPHNFYNFKKEEKKDCLQCN